MKKKKFHMQMNFIIEFIDEWIACLIHTHTHMNSIKKYMEFICSKCLYIINSISIQISANGFLLILLLHDYGNSIISKCEVRNLKIKILLHNGLSNHDT